MKLLDLCPGKIQFPGARGCCTPRDTPRRFNERRRGNGKGVAFFFFAEGGRLQRPVVINARLRVLRARTAHNLRVTTRLRDSQGTLYRSVINESLPRDPSSVVLLFSRFSVFSRAVSSFPFSIPFSYTCARACFPLRSFFSFLSVCFFSSPQPFGHAPSGNGRDFIFHGWQVAVIESDRNVLGIDYRPGRLYTIYP